MLLGDTSEISWLVFPDISASTMASTLDYIYTGSVVLHGSALADFLTVAALLQLRVEHDPILEPKLHLPSDPNGAIKYPNYNYEKYPSGYENRYKPNYDYKTPICGPECYESCSGYKSSKDICDYKTQDKRLKFSPIILQDERIPTLANGNSINEKLPVNYLKPKEVSPVYTNLDTHSTNQHFPLQKDCPPFLRTEQNGVQNDNLIIPLTSRTTPTLQNGAFASFSSVTSEIDGKVMEHPKKKTLRKVPNLMPISKFTAFKTRKGLYNKVFPSPWSPRINPVVADPRNEYVTREKVPINSVSKYKKYI